MTKSEADLKRELTQCIETGDEFLAAQETELKRLRREHLQVDQQLQKNEEELKRINRNLEDVLQK